MTTVLIELYYANRLHAKLKKLSKLPKKRRVISQAARKTLKPVFAQIKKDTPVSSIPEHKGTLKKSLKLRAMKRSRVRIGLMVITGKATWKGSHGKKWNVYYHHMVERGTKFQKGQHYMGKFVKRNRRRILKQFLRQVDTLVKEQVR